jgi:hypothetical protein
MPRGRLRSRPQRHSTLCLYRRARVKSRDDFDLTFAPSPWYGEGKRGRDDLLGKENPTFKLYVMYGKM